MTHHSSAVHQLAEVVTTHSGRQLTPFVAHGDAKTARERTRSHTRARVRESVHE